MKKTGFTLIELLAVIVVLGIISVIVIVKVDKTSKNASNFINEETVKTIESATLIYANTYINKNSDLETKNVEIITIQDLIDSGLINTKNIGNIKTTDIVLIADINNVYKIRYTEKIMPVIFINGSEEISIYQNNNYEELGAVVAIPNVGVNELDSSSITSNIDNNTIGRYEVTYSYSDATSVKRIVNVISN